MQSQSQLPYFMKSLEILNTLDINTYKYWTFSWYFCECYAFYIQYALYNQNSVRLNLEFTELVLCLHLLRRTKHSTSIVHVFLICSVISTHFNWRDLVLWYLLTYWHILKWKWRGEIPGTFTFPDIPVCTVTEHLKKKSRSSSSQDPAINATQVSFTQLSVT